MTIKYSELRKNNCFFLCALAVVNVIFSANCLIPDILVVVFDVEEGSIFCLINCVIIVISAGAPPCLQALIAIDRYVALCHPERYTKVFTKITNVLLVSLIFVIYILVVVLIIVFNYVGRMYNIFCSADVGKMKFTHLILFALPNAISNNISLTCAYKFSCRLRKQLNVARSHHWEDRLQEILEIMRFIIIEFVVPLILETPMMIACFTLSTKTLTPVTTLLYVCC